jgi:hypothetical protein
MDGIFISYRRDDSAGYAGRLYDRLAAHFGAERVFMDVEGIEPGLDFVVAIEEAVASCRVLIAVIGDEWTTAADAAGRRRLDDPNDFIRLETGAALQRGIRVVPVLVGGAVMPLVADVPEELKALTRRQAIEINHKQWEASTGELIRTLEGILKAPPGEPAAKPRPATDGSPAADGGSASGKASDEGTTDGDGRRWVLPVAVAAVALAVVGIWMSLGDRKTEGDSEKSQVSKAVEAPRVAVAPGPKAAGQASTPPAAAKVPASKPVAPEVPPAASDAKTLREPVAVAKPLAPPPPVEPATAARPEPAPAAVLPPMIREFKAEVTAARTRLCYRVSHAESLTLSPRPGELSKLVDDCIDVKVDTATTFVLTARNGNKSARKTLAVVPRPAATASPPEAPASVAAPSSLPVKGERWAYRSSGKWPTSPKRRFEIVVQSVADSLVTDELRVIEPESVGEVRRARGNKPDFIAWTAIGPEFSPYMGAYVALAQQGSLSGFPTPDFDPQWTEWYSKAEMIGQESVSVPAGTFNAFKVEVWSSRRRTGSLAQVQIEPVRVRYLIWYAPLVKRYVRMQRSVMSADNSENEKDVFELVAHRGP